MVEDRRRDLTLADHGFVCFGGESGRRNLFEGEG